MAFELLSLQARIGVHFDTRLGQELAQTSINVAPLPL